MATVRAEMFDVEMFGKLVALFDSNNAGEAGNAFRKAVLMCEKNGLHFCDAAGMAFGQGDGGEATELRDELRRQEAQHADQLTEAAAEIERLRDQVAALSGNGGGDGEEEHVIDLGGRLRRAWRFPQFRLFVLTVMVAAGFGVASAQAYGMARIIGGLCLFVFGAWSVAQFRKRGLGQMFMKWLVYCGVLMLGGMLADGADVQNRPAVFLCVLAVALVLTLSKVSEWLSERVRVHVWESDPVHVVRAWF